MNYTITYRIISSRNIEMPSFQRPLLERRVKLIAENFDERLANEPKVVLLSGVYYCWDGQHTIRARELRNGGKPLPIRCKVYEGLTNAEAALLFAKQLDYTVKIKPNDKVKAKIIGKDPETLSMLRCIASCGLKADGRLNANANHVSCLETCEKIYSKHGEMVLHDVLLLIADTWGGATESLRGDFINATKDFYLTYSVSPNFSRERFVKKLGAFPAAAILRDSKLLPYSAASSRIVRKLLELYNNRAAKKL
jgi:hypothetical protein